MSELPNEINDRLREHERLLGEIQRQAEGKDFCMCACHEYYPELLKRAAELLRTVVNNEDFDWNEKADQWLKDAGIEK